MKGLIERTPFSQSSIDMYTCSSSSKQSPNSTMFGCLSALCNLISA